MTIDFGVGLATLSLLVAVVFRWWQCHSGGRRATRPGLLGEGMVARHGKLLQPVFLAC